MAHIHNDYVLVDVVIDHYGTCRLIYDETIDLVALGDLSIQRASHVEPTAIGNWQADLAPVGGPVLGPFAMRSEALAAEVQWLALHWLPAGARSL